MNKNLWNLYKASEEGKALIELFNPDSDNYWDNAITVVDKTQDMVGGDILENVDITMEASYVNTIMADYTPEEGATWPREQFAAFIEEFEIREYEFNEEGDPILLDKEFIPKTAFRQKAANMLSLSFVLYGNAMFKPMLWPSRFDYLLKCCDALNIEMPDIPRSNDYKEYLMYYYDICVAWKQFQDENNLTNAECCACIYGFGPMCIETENKHDLPKPTNVWFTGASGKGDFDFLDVLGENTEYNRGKIWACNERTRRGDIIVLYCTSPRSYIHSIWRANSGGIFNPFDYYHCRTTVCDGVRTPKISFNDLKTDAYFKEVPIVRRNLQGLNGIELTAEDYSELLRFIEQKGGDINALPKLFEGGQFNFGEIKLEKDVEEKILIPMLKKLGYAENDWDRQLSQKAGRGLKAIPDFVFFPKGEKHFAAAPMVIEAKLDMSVVTEQQKAFKQGLSYARMLRSKLMGICDKERLVMYKVDDNGYADRCEPIFEDHWQTIFNDEVVGAKLNKLIGREIVMNM